MHNFVSNREDICAELGEVVRLFVPCPQEDDPTITHTFFKDGNVVRNQIEIAGAVYRQEDVLPDTADALVRTRKELRACKLALYKALQRHYKRDLPWGSLTGIRPSKLAYQMLEEGIPLSSVADALTQTFLVSPEKSALTQAIVRNQSEVIQDRLAVSLGENGMQNAPVCSQLVNLYVHIPFCTSRCQYCSFYTNVTDKQKWLIQPYIDALVAEIQDARRMLDEAGMRVFSVYIGGGTPTAVSAEQLEQVLAALPAENIEVTCEAGRPDTITREKLQLMQFYGVNRISVNPQTLQDATLAAIGRNHTAAEFFAAYALADTFGFRKNVDTIAGLQGETLADFRATVEGILSLRPENITVHTLARKRGSRLIESAYEENADVEAMVDYSVRALTESGYVPYYLYRQKQMAGNLENIGWSLPRFLCVNNITTMEETLSVVACGAGAISKRIYPQGRIERLANVRDIILYLDQFEERLKKKRLFFAN